MMKTKMLAFAAATAIAMATPASAATYIVNVSGNGVSATGSIETDGTLGLLARVNVLDWQFNLTDAGGSFMINGPSNSQLLFFNAPALTATATGLFFDFSGSGAVLFQNPQVGSTINFLCYTGSALCGGSYNRISITVQNFGGGISQAGVQQIATASAVPEPTAWAMMIAGVGMAGGALRRRRAANTTVRFA